jgi:hypothetical protein
VNLGGALTVAGALTSTSGPLAWGGGSSQGLSGNDGGVINNVVTYNYPTTSYIRNRWMSDIVTANTNSSQIDEGFFLNRQYSGTATITGEINGIHSYLSDLAGPTFNNSMENFEASTGYNASHSSVTMYLAQPNINATGSATYVYGVSTGMFNYNTTAGSVGQWTGFSCKAMQGGGAQPTSAFCLQNTDATQSISTAGQVNIGSYGISTERLKITGVGTSTGVDLRIFNSANTALFVVQDNGNITGTAALSLTGTGAFSSTLTSPQLITTGTASTAVFGAGAGGGASVSIVGAASAQVVTLSTGTSPTANAILATVTINPNGCPTAVYPSVTPGSAATAAAMLTAPVWGGPGGVGKTYTINSGNVALAASTTYVWNVHVDCQ